MRGVDGQGGDLLEPSSMVAHRYRVTSYLGDRGFGQVYDAHDSATERRVALMRLGREFSDPETRDSFYETRSTAAVEDPRIVDLSDYGEDLDGRLFLVMPWVDAAAALDQLIGQALAWPRIRSLIEQIAAALEAAHGKGVLHGGLEPCRVLIDRSDGVHIVDFGLAPALREYLGARDYLAPEQVRGETVDARTDIYALGRIACQLVTGSLPSASNREPAVRAGLPKELGPLLALAMAEDPSSRLASASEFLQRWRRLPAVAIAVSAKPAAPRLAPPPPRVVAKPPPKHEALATPPKLEAPPRLEALPAPEPVAAVAIEAEPVPALAFQPAPEPAPAPVAVAVEAAIEPSQPVIEPAGLRLASGERATGAVAAVGPARARRFGKLELAIMAFLAFDLLVFGAWKLVTSEQEVESDVAVVDQPDPPVAVEPPPAVVSQSQPAPPAAEPDVEPLDADQPSAAELPLEAATPGPVRPAGKALSDKAIRQTLVGARTSMIDRCTEGKIRRTLKLSVKVKPSGKVEYARVVGSMNETTLGRCIVKQVYRLEFPPTTEGGADIYTLRLQ